jgi:hypothetical protein
MCLSIIKPFLTHCFDYGLFRLPTMEIGLTAGVTGQQGMLTPHRYLIQHLVYQGIDMCSLGKFTCYILDWFVVYCLMPLYGDVIGADKGPQNLSLSSEFTVFEQGRMFIVPYLL